MEPELRTMNLGRGMIIFRVGHAELYSEAPLRMTMFLHRLVAVSETIRPSRNLAVKQEKETKQER